MVDELAELGDAGDGCAFSRAPRNHEARAGSSAGTIVTSDVSAGTAVKLSPCRVVWQWFVALPSMAPLPKRATISGAGSVERRVRAATVGRKVWGDASAGLGLGLRS